MANEIQIAYGTSGRTLYAVVRAATGTVWNGASFVAYNGANWATYAIAMTEQGSSGYYTGDFPAAAAGVYNVESRDRAGGSAATTDPVAGAGALVWDGTAVVYVSTAANADKLLGRNIAGGSDGGRTVHQALAAARNKVAFDVPAAGQFTVYDETDAVALWTGTYTRAAVNTLVSVDPA